MEGECSKKKKPTSNRLSLIDVVFSWCLEDVLNKDLYMNKVEKIPESFQSVQQYFGSFIFSLLEETRAELSSSLDFIASAPYAGVNSLQECGECVYDVKVEQWMYKSSSSKPYKMFPGDILVFTDSKPQTISDLKQEGGTWTLALVTEGTCNEFKVKASCCIEAQSFNHKPQFVVFLRNITTNRNIWNALHTFGNLSIVKEVLYTNNVAEENCSLCSGKNDFIQNEEIYTTSLFKLNDSQREAVLASLHKFQCYHKSSVELIWCPPGTGKTMTLSILLFILQRMSCRTLVCAPTNVAITEAACHLLKLVKASSEAGSISDALLCSLGNILFMGSEDLLEVASDIEEIHLNYRVERLLEVLRPLTGLRHCSCSMIDFLEGCVSQYHIFMDGELMENKEPDIVKNYSKGECKTFLEFVIERFRSIALLLRSSISIFCTHIARSFILDHNFETMVSIMKLLDTFETLLSQNNINCEELLVEFSHAKNTESCHYSFKSISTLLNMKRGECIYILKVLLTALDALDLPSAMDPSSVKKFCFQTASLIFCTASSSHMLHSLNMKPLELLVIDESAQLKECELITPLQLPGLRHAILFGDHCQLPAMVNSNVSARAGFGRSLFERLSLMGHSKHFLNIQYRMHPLISFFPNSKFYGNKIVDAPNVKSGLAKRYLPGQIFGSYSFINISCGIEELDGVHHSWKNMVEVAVIIKVVNNLYKVDCEWNGSKQKLSIGVISPYTAQVIAVQEKIGKKYENLDGFAVKVKSIEGFQGGEADIIILSTVRCNSDGSISFASNHGRINVALTRARHCLWILGNETTLLNSQSVWKSIVCDAKDRQCFYNADEDENLAKFMLEVKKELNEYDDLLNFDSVPFESARWKVLFSDYFRKSFKKLRSIEMKKLVLKVWDILPLEDIPKLAIRLDALFGKYTNDYLNRCKAKCFDGDLEVPMSWVTSLDFVRYKNSSYTGDMADSDDVCFGRKTFVENSMVSDSLTLMKFYSLSSGVVSHLLSRCDGKELDFPFELSDQETDVILFDRSCFILGRSGTGKTTVLTTKLFQKEQLHHIASEGFHEPQSCSTVEIFPKKEDGERVGGTKRAVLHQIFVTVNPKLCYAIKQQICHLKRFACVGDASEGSTSTGLDEIDEMLQFTDIPDSFIDLPTKLYPLVLTFHKFLMMLDGTVGNSFFGRFPEAIGHSHGTKRASKSVALKTFIRTKEVNYERFRSSYWPRFNNEQTKKFDSSTVFTEIMSHIKGGLQVGESCDDKLGLEDYLSLAERRVSTLGRKKMKRGESDLTDLVIDIHNRLKVSRYDGDNMDFVYIDEVQDLSMRQVALFKYLCKNVAEGFVFSGDTAQTIARGIDFRFQDIRFLFYKEFLLGSRNDGAYGKKEKGKIADVFQLSQNFRTHAGILNLAQSVINLLYHFFPLSIDTLRPETSLIDGQVPVLLKSLNGENDFISIFKNGGNDGGKIIGFGADQVILVRDDIARNKIVDYVGKQALILTIMESKGLEFQYQQYLKWQSSVIKLILGITRDVFLYNFFGSSPSKNQWRVIYKYMIENDLLDSTSTTSFPSFIWGKHNMLCSELKHLYVAITRTRQKLWIFENVEELSEPMFVYWKKLGFVQVREFNESLAQEMQVASSQEEWKSRGIKFFYQNNYEMARMCFERAGEIYWEKWAMAAGLRAAANHMSCSNSQLKHINLMKAAETFDSIGKSELSAQCYYEASEYERAGTIYLDKFGNSKLEDAAECFTRAGCYKTAAQLYAKCNLFTKCMSVCSGGKLFDMGFQFLQYWKDNALSNNGLLNSNSDIEETSQMFLESAARYYHEIKYSKKMMMFVKAFHSKNSMRAFLMSLGSLDELLSLEKEWGNFQEAAKIARMQGDLLLEADLLENTGNYEDASLSILLYVFANSLWAPRSQGWPLKQFPRKEKLLTKAKEFAKNGSDNFFEFVCTEANILSDQECSLPELMQNFRSSQRHNSVRGEILCARKVLDSHLELSTSAYSWGDVAGYLDRHAKDRLSQNQVSVETLVYFWNFWKNKIWNIFEFLGCPGNGDDSGEFCLSYLAVNKQFIDTKVVYLLLKPDAYWLREIDDQYFMKKGKLVSIGALRFAQAARRYWCSEIFSVGVGMLEKLKALYEFATQNALPLYSQTFPVVHMFVLSKSLMETRFVDCRQHIDTLKFFLDLSMNLFLDNIVSIDPLDWRKLLTENMIFLRAMEQYKSVLQEVIINTINSTSKLTTHAQVGKVTIETFGSGKLSSKLYKQITEVFDRNSPWREFFLTLGENAAQREVYLVHKFHKALEDTYNARWANVNDYISPGCFLYLVELLLIWVCSLRETFFTSKSSFVEWLIHREWKAIRNTNSLAAKVDESSLVVILEFVSCIVEQLLYHEQDTINWFGKANIILDPDSYMLLVLRLFVVTCVLCLNHVKYFGLLYHLLGRTEITSHLPKDFYESLMRLLENDHEDARIHVIAEAFRKIGNPLVIVSPRWHCSNFSRPDAIFVNRDVNKGRDNILKVLFQNDVKDSPNQNWWQ
ncbi:uncharacterized protein LOC115980900 [Quercus lobata]|uniref:uncharacterized protein LOC115980900 n=1 Tax=Quercus lobata TaxID=97700 RepID=UPI001244236C|nr:uncharacterized protein LOC115980900 [Quercus lobata]